MPRKVSFRVDGPPRPLQRHRERNPARVKAGQNRNYDPSEVDKEQVAWACRVAMRDAGVEMLTGPLRLTVRCVFEHPKSHYGKGKFKARMKPTAPKHYHTYAPDWSNCAKLVEDALNGLLYRDDSRIAAIGDESEKVYGPKACTLVTVEEMEDKPKEID